MGNKQTAVDWLFHRMNEIRVDDEGGKLNILDFFNLQFEAKEQAKAMEKEQIIDAYKSGCVDEMWELNNTENEEHYYNKTYGK